jgi:hypothetical protein
MIKQILDRAVTALLFALWAFAPGAGPEEYTQDRLVVGV